LRLDWSAAAVADLKTIVEWIEQDRDVPTANRVGRTIYEAAQSLRTMPFLGRQGRVDNTRELVIPPLPYILVYQVSGERIAILSVVHGAQRWP
jgi:addiction module RelE/StbE family toxin